MPSLFETSTSSLLLTGAAVLCLTCPAHAADKFKVTDAECEMFWYSKHTPVLKYDILEDRQADYNQTPPPDYFRQAAVRTREYCDRTSSKPQSVFGAPRTIRGVWFQSNDGRFKALFNLETGALDEGAGVTNSIGDRYAAAQRSLADKAEAERRHLAQIEEVRTRDARKQELEEEVRKSQQEKLARENAREALFFSRKDLQLARLGAEVTQAHFTFINDVRTNPFHFRKLGLAVVRTQFNRMVSEKVALFGNELAPVFVHIEDVDRFTRSGETVMLALRVRDRGEVERSYGSLPEIILSAMKAEPIFGEYVGAYTCPANDCGHIFDEMPPT